MEIGEQIKSLEPENLVELLKSSLGDEYVRLRPTGGTLAVLDNEGRQITSAEGIRALSFGRLSKVYFGERPREVSLRDGEGRWYGFSDVRLLRLTDNSPGALKVAGEIKRRIQRVEGGYRILEQQQVNADPSIAEALNRY